MCGLAGIGAGANWAAADTLNVGGPATFTYAINLQGYGSESGGAGSFQNVTLNGQSLPFMYCVDLNHNINYLNYTNTSVNRNAYINDADASKVSPVYALTDGVGHLSNAGAIEWLITNVAPGVVNDPNAVMGLQLAIWQLEYGNKFSFNPGSTGNGGTSASTILSNFENDLNKVGYSYNYQNTGLASGFYQAYSTAQTGATKDGYSSSDVLWINAVGSDGTFAQAQVSYAPLPGTFTMTSIFLGMIGVVAAGRAWKKQTAVAA
jgi:hypothetical protein